jgi:hypothetical protein
LFARVIAGIATNCLSNRKNVEAACRRCCPDIAAVEVIGAADADMVRDKHPELHLSTGGAVDVYVRAAPQIKTVSKAATMPDRANPEIWEVVIEPADFPCVYFVEKVLSGTVECKIVEAAAYPATDGFTAKTGCRVLFSVPSELLASRLPGDPFPTFDVVVCGMPHIDELQDYLARDDLAVPGVNFCVKAPIPCFLTLTLQLDGDDGRVRRDEIAKTVAEYVNSTGFTRKLSLSRLAAVIVPQLPPAVTLVDVSFSGKIVLPHKDIPVAGSNIFAAPAEIGERNVALFTDPAHVLIP